MITFADPIDLDVLRIRHDFISMPDLRASSAAIADRFQLGPRHAAAALESLVTDGFLERTVDNLYVRVIGTPKAAASRMA